VCNFHQRFIVNYAESVAPLIQLLRKNIPWSWSTEMQKTSETLRNKFANSIHLVQPDENLPYIVNTDASARAIGAVLSQQNSEGIANIVSTASGVLTQTEQRYTTCEQELLGIVYALEKFRIYICRHKVILYTDNKALTFLNKCAIMSNRVARWMVNLQQYDIELRHVKGTQNHLADVISGNPAGLDTTEIRNLTKPNVIMVNRINLNVDKTVCKDMKNLTELQKTHQNTKDLRQVNPRVRKVRL
jgi:ribonuclease HI